MQEADVDEYSIALGQLMRLLKLAVELRIDNVKERRGLKKKQREDRQDCIDKEAERVNRRSEEMQKATDAFNETMAAQKAAKAEAMEEEDGDEEEAEAFDEEDFTQQFDEENPPFEIREEIIDDIDNDYNFPDDGEEK